MAKPIANAEKKRIRDYLKAHGHATARVDRLKLDTDDDVRDSILGLHGVSPAEYGGRKRGP